MRKVKTHVFDLLTDCMLTLILVPWEQYHRGALQEGLQRSQNEVLTLGETDVAWDMRNQAQESCRVLSSRSAPKGVAQPDRGCLVRK